MIDNGVVMHFDILIEDKSGKKALENLLPKIIDRSQGHTFIIHEYKGIGHLPKNINSAVDATKRQLLNNLPKLLNGYGKTYCGYGESYQAVVIVVVDLDDKCMHNFRNELYDIWNSCSHKPNVKFCFAIEEGEAWLLGDIAAILKAFPNAKTTLLNNYQNDSICGTWELLADAIYPGGSAKLKKEGWVVAGKAKYEWAEKITPHMDVENNLSPSFCYFRDSLRSLAI